MSTTPIVEIKLRITGEVIATGKAIAEALRGADLRGANLGGADLRGADLGGARLSWQSHDLLAEILKRAAEEDVSKLKFAGLVLICRERCWGWFVQQRDPLSGWALDVLAEWVQEGDDAPSAVRSRITSEEVA